MLGEFEYVLITTAAGLGENAYGVAIRDEVEAAIQRKCSMGALYTTLDRLEAKGLLKTWVGEATPQRGGRGKRMVRVTPQGVRAALGAMHNAVALRDLPRLAFLPQQPLAGENEEDLLVGAVLVRGRREVSLRHLDPPQPHRARARFAPRIAP